MRKVTTTKKINEAIANNLAKVEKAEVYYKTSSKKETIDIDKFQENLQFLCESGCFMGAIGWHYERDCKSNDYICETGRMNPDSEIIVAVYLNVGEGVSKEDIERMLDLEEE